MSGERDPRREPDGGAGGSSEGGHTGVSRASSGCVTFRLRDEPPSRDQVIRMRVLELLNVPTLRARRWAELQAGLGGRVRPDELRAGVDALLESGEAVEAWDVFSAHDRREPRHVVALTSRARYFAWRQIVEAR